MTMTEVQNYICDIQKFTKKNTLAHTKRYLELLGNPCAEKKIIHVAGTNGKGSVCSYLCALLREHGFHTAMFVSPHLVDMRERMLLDEEMVSEERFLAAFKQVKSVADRAANGEYTGETELHHPTFFEFLFLMAMLVFEEAEQDYIILETGMGGRLDATNVFDKPQLTIITEIGLDHCMYLGDTREKIAFEKAGIIKPGVPLVYVSREKSVSDVLSQTAERCGSMAFAVDKSLISNVNINDKSIDFSYKSRYYNNVDCTLSTRALYQTENASVALTALEVLLPKECIDIHKMRSGLAGVCWPGRMEEIGEGVFVDGAHNEDGIAAFLESVRAASEDGRRILLFSVVGDKEYEKMISRIEESGLFETYVIAGIADARGLAEEQIVNCFQQNRRENIYLCGSVQEAYHKALDLKKDGVLYIAGSLYLVGEIKALLKEES